MVGYSLFSLFMVISIMAQLLFSYQIIKFAGNLYFHLAVFLILTLCFVPITILNSTVITIDTFAKKITFKNIFSYSARIYSFSELEGYVDSSYQIRYGTEKVIYLVKDEIRVERIPEFYYSNFEKLKLDLSTLNYMGDRVFSLYDHLKILFRLSVLD